MLANTLLRKDVPTVATVIDDDEIQRDELAIHLEEIGFRVRLLTGKYGKDIDRLIREASENTDYVFCDNRLQRRGFATFYGIEVATILCDRKIPTVLITQYQQPDDLLLRRQRKRLPVVLDRNDISRDALIQALQKCKEEVAGRPPSDRRTWRSIVRVEAINKVSESALSTVTVNVPAWNPHESIDIPLDMIPKDFRRELRQGTHLLAAINIGAKRKEDLVFERFEKVAEPAADDGLA